MATVPSSRVIYGRPPIVEAVIDIQCVNRTDLTIRDLSRLAEDFAPDYQVHSRSVEVSETHDDDGTFQKTQRIVGLVLRSSDERHVLQIHLNGFTFSRMAPYERWEILRARAEAAWQQYATSTQPEHLRRIGVRYINRIELGVSTVSDLAVYTKLHPVTPWRLTAPLAGFFLQVRWTEGASSLVVNESIAPNPQSGELALLLDLDATAEPGVERDDAYLWNVIEQLHVEVEHAFEASITDRVRESIR